MDKLPPKVPENAFFAALFPHNIPLLDLRLEVLTLNQVGDVLVVLVLLLELVALGELAERREGVGAELVEDAGDELGELLVLAVAVDGERVGLDGGVDCWRVC